YLVVYVIPFLKYPASPPSVGNPDTINERTTTYFGMVLVSVVSAVTMIYLGRRLTARLGAWNAALVAGAIFIVTVTVVQFLLPSINEVPEVFPATVLWNFRMASLGTQLVMWATIGLLFGALVHRRLESRQPAPDGVDHVHCRDFRRRCVESRGGRVCVSSNRSPDWGADRPRLVPAQERPHQRGHRRRPAAGSGSRPTMSPPLIHD